MSSICKGRESERGMALVLVLLVLSVLTAMVVEFAYGTYVNTALLTNWQKLQEISLAAESGVSVAVEGEKLRNTLLKNNVKDDIFNVRELRLPQMDPFELGIGVELTITDENSKFNLNKIVGGNGEKNEAYFKALERLLKALELDHMIAVAIKDYIDTDILPDGPGTEKRAANTFLQSVEELLLVAGIDREVYNTLLPYVTVFGEGAAAGAININTAEMPVLRSLNEDITEELAERIIAHRPFSNNTFNTVPGLTGLVIDAGILLSVKGDTYSVISKAVDKDGLTREIHCVVQGEKVLYWREL